MPTLQDHEATDKRFSWFALSLMLILLIDWISPQEVLLPGQKLIIIILIAVFASQISAPAQCVPIQNRDATSLLQPEPEPILEPESKTSPLDQVAEHVEKKPDDISKTPVIPPPAETVQPLNKHSATVPRRNTTKKNQGRFVRRGNKSAKRGSVPKAPPSFISHLAALCSRQHGTNNRRRNQSKYVQELYSEARKVDELRQAIRVPQVKETSKPVAPSNWSGKSTQKSATHSSPPAMTQVQAACRPSMVAAQYTAPQPSATSSPPPAVPQTQIAAVSGPSVDAVQDTAPQMSTTSSPSPAVTQTQIAAVSGPSVVAAQGTATQKSTTASPPPAVTQVHAVSKKRVRFVDDQDTASQKLAISSPLHAVTQTQIPAVSGLSVVAAQDTPMSYTPSSAMPSVSDPEDSQMLDAAQDTAPRKSAAYSHLSAVTLTQVHALAEPSVDAAQDTPMSDTPPSAMPSCADTDTPMLDAAQDTAPQNSATYSQLPAVTQTQIAVVSGPSVDAAQDTLMSDTPSSAVPTIAVPTDSEMLDAPNGTPYGMPHVSVPSITGSTDSEMLDAPGGIPYGMPHASAPSITDPADVQMLDAPVQTPYGSLQVPAPSIRRFRTWQDFLSSSGSNLRRTRYDMAQVIVPIINGPTDSLMLDAPGETPFGRPPVPASSIKPATTIQDALSSRGSSLKRTRCGMPRVSAPSITSPTGSSCPRCAKPMSAARCMRLDCPGNKAPAHQFPVAPADTSTCGTQDGSSAQPAQQSPMPSTGLSTVSGATPTAEPRSKPRNPYTPAPGPNLPPGKLLRELELGVARGYVYSMVDDIHSRLETTIGLRWLRDNPSTKAHWDDADKKRATKRFFEDVYRRFNTIRFWMDREAATIDRDEMADFGLSKEKLQDLKSYFKMGRQLNKAYGSAHDATDNLLQHLYGR